MSCIVTSSGFGGWYTINSILSYSVTEDATYCEPFLAKIFTFLEIKV